MRSIRNISLAVPVFFGLSMASPAAAQAGLPIRAASNEIARDEQIGNFAYLDSHDDADGSDRSSIVVTHDGYTPSRKGGVLSWSCGPQGLLVMFYFDRPMWATEDGKVPVRYRVDQGEPTEFEHWPLLPGNRGAAIQAEHMGIFTRGVMPGTSVQIQVSDQAESTATYRFTLAGLRSGLERLSCAKQFH
jgi:hypothetical protein